MKKVTNTHSPTQNTTKIYWSSFFVVPLFIFLMVITQCKEQGGPEEAHIEVYYDIVVWDSILGRPVPNMPVEGTENTGFFTPSFTARVWDTTDAHGRVKMMFVKRLPFRNGVRVNQYSLDDYEKWSDTDYLRDQEFAWENRPVVNDTIQIRDTVNIIPSGIMRFHIDTLFVGEEFVVKIGNKEKSIDWQKIDLNNGFKPEYKPLNFHLHRNISYTYEASVRSNNITRSLQTDTFTAQILIFTPRNPDLPTTIKDGPNDRYLYNSE